MFRGGGLLRGAGHQLLRENTALGAASIFAGTRLRSSVRRLPEPSHILAHSRRAAGHAERFGKEVAVEIASRHVADAWDW